MSRKTAVNPRLPFRQDIKKTAIRPASANRIAALSASESNALGCLLAVILVRNGQLLAALCTARCQYATAILRCHTLTETMLVYAATIVWLKCSLHCLMLFFIVIISLLSTNRVAKLLLFFEIAKF